MLNRFACALALSGAGLCAAEVRVRLQDLPLAVQNTIRQETKDSKIRGFSKEIENGKTFYEAETITTGGQSRDILMDPAGTVVEVEQEIALDSVAEPAQKALRSAAGTGKILKVEAVTRGAIVSYEAVVRKGGKKTEVAVSADGTLRNE